jgi:DNA-binding MarR family transcriptional regulator
MVEAVDEASGSSGATAAALSALLHFLEEPTIDLLRRVLGLTSSGAVRLVDRLEAAGWVQRVPSRDDGRATSVHLTSAGRRAAIAVTRARGDVLELTLGVLSPEERETFEALASKVLVGMTRGPGAVRWICRLCDMDACGWREGGCPIRNAREAGVQEGTGG